MLCKYISLLCSTSGKLRRKVTAMAHELRTALMRYLRPQSSLWTYPSAVLVLDSRAPVSRRRPSKEVSPAGSQVPDSSVGSHPATSVLNCAPAFAILFSLLSPTPQSNRTLDLRLPHICACLPTPSLAVCTICLFKPVAAIARP